MLAPLTIDSLPNEILLSILPYLSTSELLSITTLNRRLYSAAVALLHDRLVHAASLPDHELQLECFTPAQRLFSEPSYCQYVGTDVLSVPETDVRSLSELNQLYSHFRPVRQSGGDSVPETASDTIHLDESEPFAQLCTVVNIVKRGPRKGLFLSHVNVQEGLIRTWREWLAKRAEGSSEKAEEEAAPPILWADARQDVGIRFGLVERRALPRQAAVFVMSDEDFPVSYRLEFSELLVRTSRLLVKLEKSETEELTNQGNAIIIASF
ncbi:hypothetical protein CONLIGDRAFT_389738 [Coniochaeta ligniaria NRRL 30616]|uniref:F-box domain-containing protein n=1 Tax=Coniochaeta ligniaria NRRL 30616 TaxID=1408157 RepID=A0A1J7IN93_9PEZI|nr:hypothetical protein CONLIGDRAFT_389738 [Coniochaeta ligniaria NRRL 30616]